MSEWGIQARTLGIPKGAYRIVPLGESGLHALFVTENLSFLSIPSHKQTRHSIDIQQKKRISNQSLAPVKRATELLLSFLSFSSSVVLAQAITK